MAKEGGYNIENLYMGGYNTLDPNKAYNNSFTGYRSTAGSLGMTTDPRTANILKDASTKLNSGLKHMELEFVSPEIMDSVPKQNLEEMRQLSKLIGNEISVHGPVIDTMGMSREGFSEMNREASEKKITETLLRSHELNPNGNILVNFHTAEGISGSTWKTLGSVDGTKPREAKRLIAIDKESGKMVPLDTDIRYYPDAKVLSKGKKTLPEENLELINYNEWDKSLNQLFFNKERADEILLQNRPLVEPVLKEIKERMDKGVKNPFQGLTQEQRMYLQRYKDAEIYLDEVNKGVKSIFSKGYQYGSKDQKEKFEEISERYKENIKDAGMDPLVQSIAIKQLITDLQDPRVAPKMFVPLEEFATEQSAKTFGNAAFNAFNKFKDPNKTPIVLIENPPAGFGLSTGEDLKNLVVASREEFVKKAMTEKNMKRSEAEKIAEKLIGATWDVGHINMLRKEGFKEEDILKETEKVAPYVRHVHLSDNFGFEHTELPMGMGNVPMKEIMSRLGEKGFEGKKIIEASSWWQHFQTNPLKESLEGLGSKMYSTGPGPYWNQSLGLQQGYFTGYGMMLPTNNYQTFGAGFSQLPQELGGEVARGGGTGRFSQRGME